MIARRLPHIRWGRVSVGECVFLLLLMTVCSFLLYWFVLREHPADSRPLWDRIVATLLFIGEIGLLIFLFASVLTSVDLVRQTVARYQTRRIERRLAQMNPFIQDALPHAEPATLNRVVRLLEDDNTAIRQQALAATWALLRARPDLPVSEADRVLITETLHELPGFPRTLAETPRWACLLDCVTLGAKLGAGSAEKRLAPVTSDPGELARWVEEYRSDQRNPEIQVSVGYDTGHLPSLDERSRFIGLYLFIATTDLKQFQALLRRPARDPNAANGLVIRGDVVEARYPGQARGHRLDYVFPLPVRLSAVNLAGLFHEIQVLNLGLLMTAAQDAAIVLHGGQPPWLDARRQGIAAIYRDFERRFVRLLRRFDGYRDGRQIHVLVASDHAERVRAMEEYHLEECLYPQLGWVVPLYDADTRWDRLLEPLRAVEGMLLHQGSVEGSDVTRGSALIRETRQLGYRTASMIESLLNGDGSNADVPLPQSPHADPFIDAADEEATRHYLVRVGHALHNGQVQPEQLPDPATFRRAAAYYEVGPEQTSSCRGPIAPEAEP